MLKDRYLVQVPQLSNTFIHIFIFIIHFLILMSWLHFYILWFLFLILIYNLWTLYLFCFSFRVLVSGNPEHGKCTLWTTAENEKVEILVYIYISFRLFSYNVDLKKAWNYAFSAHEMQYFLTQGDFAPLQPPPRGQPPGPPHHLILCKCVLGFFIYTTVIWVHRRIENNCIPPCIYFALFLILWSLICNILIFGINHIAFGYDFIFLFFDLYNMGWQCYKKVSK